MTPTHPLLARQLRRHLALGALAPEVAAAAAAAVAPLVAAVDAAYHEADAERGLLAHSLETMSAELVERHERLRRSEAQYRAVFDHSAVGIAVHGPDGRLQQVNGAFAELLGYAPDELLGRAAAELSVEEDGAVTREPMRELAAGLRAQVDAEHRFVRRDGRVIWGQVTVSRIDAGGAEPGGQHLVSMLQDVTARREMESELERRAFHDSLTGLANRALFRDRVEHALARAAGARRRNSSTPRGVAVLFLDLDGFKHVNDSFGHEAGDRLLTVTGARLLASVRGSDTVARLGGDEFAVLLEELGDPAEAAICADRMLAALQAPIPIGGREVFVGASIGIAHAELGDGPEELLRSADAAMYAAKAAGKGRHALYDPAMHVRAVERVQLETDLRYALDGGQFELHYQPLMDLQSGALHGAEALLRWNHPTLGNVSPATFIPIAEETGLIVPIGRWVIDRACAEASRWIRSGAVAPEFTLSVNVSARQLQDPGLEAAVLDALSAHALPSRALVLEITESVLMQRTDLVIARLEALKALGVRLAIDDFGTGYSSLSYLRRFPVDTLKIDKSFVDGLAAAAGGVRDVTLVRTIVALGQALGLSLVAEGIEAADQGAALAEMGCGVGQGYHYSRPLPPARFDELLALGAAPRPAA